MVSNIDSILNWVIPIGIICFFIFVFLSNEKIRNGFDAAIDKVKDFFSWIGEQLAGKKQQTEEIVYG